jgi:putative hemolysin
LTLLIELKIDKMLEYINLDEIIKSSDSKMLKRLPKFAVRALKRIICQDELNVILNKYANDIGISFLAKMIDELNLTLEVEGKENLPESGKCFFAANHPFGIADGLVLTYLVSEKYGDLKAIGNEAFMYIPNLRPLIAAVNVFGQNPKDYIEELEKVFQSDIPITHFPAGEVSRVYHRKIQDNSWQKSFITKSVAANRPIVPIHFYGRNSRKFYAIFLIRRCLGIKLNIELMLLPSELLLKKNKTIKVKIGKPILPGTFDKSKNAGQWAQYLKEQVYNL